MKIKKVLTTLVFAGSVLAFASGCGFFGGAGETGKTEETSEIPETSESPETSGSAETGKEQETIDVTKVNGLEYDHKIVVDNAKFFDLDAYKDGYYMVTTHYKKSAQQLLVVPEGKDIPEGLDSGVITVKQPIATSKIDSMTLVDLLGDINEGLLDKLSLVTSQKEKIYIDKLADNMDKGITQFAGSERNPDIELLKKVNPQIYLCKPGLEKEAAYDKIKEAGFQPFVTYIHNESDTLGRIEWIKVLGVIYGDLASAENFYNDQKAKIESIDKTVANEKTFVMCCLNKEKNTAYVRRTNDPIAKIGEFAGGKNMLSDVDNVSWEKMSIEDFISKYKDADYIIYMDKHADAVNTLDDLKNISEALSDFKAVKDNNVWRTRTDFYQMNKYGDMAKELNGIFAGDNSVIESAAEFVKVK